MSVVREGLCRLAGTDQSLLQCPCELRRVQEASLVRSGAAGRTASVAFEEANHAFKLCFQADALHARGGMLWTRQGLHASERGMCCVRLGAVDRPHVPVLSMENMSYAGASRESSNR